jgi:hypothetical protein
MMLSVEEFTDAIYADIERDGPRGDWRSYVLSGSAQVAAIGMAWPGMKEQIDAELAEYRRRMPFIDRYAWAVPSQEAVAAIVEHADGPILEVGAGRGLWAALLRLSGAVVYATDIEPGGRSPTEHYLVTVDAEMTYTSVERCGAAEAAVRHPDAGLLFLCWPPYDEPMGAEALRAFRGPRLAYIGEDDGCTGDEMFRDLLTSEWLLDRDVAIPQWPGLHDALFLYHRAPLLYTPAREACGVRRGRDARKGGRGRR